MVKKKMILLYLLLGLALVGAAVGGFALFGLHQMKKVQSLSSREVLNYTLRNNDEGIITIGILEDGQKTYKIYGENGKELPQSLHTYEIGSLTKTFTAALVCQAVQDGKLQLDASINAYLELPEKGNYPTIRQLLTHTSGYKGFYFETPMVSNFLRGRNDFYGISSGMVLKQLENASVSDQAHPFLYSNFGYAVLGQLLEKIYEKPYGELVNEFTAYKLGLADTHISTRGDLGKLWDWYPGDAYMSAGALTSNVEDMMAYAHLLLNGQVCEGENLNALTSISVNNAQYDLLGIRMNAVAYGWILDQENGIIWHNGGTGNYNCYLGLDPEHNRAVVVLSNLPPNYRIPATVVGIKLLDELTK